MKYQVKSIGEEADGAEYEVGPVESLLAQLQQELDYVDRAVTDLVEKARPYVLESYFDSPDVCKAEGEEKYNYQESPTQKRLKSLLEYAQDIRIRLHEVRENIVR